MSWKVHCFIQQYLLFALNEAICQFLSKFDIYPISIWRNFFQFEFVRNFVYTIFCYHTSTGCCEQNFPCCWSHIGSSLKVPGLTHCGGGGHYGTILEVPKCENGQKVTKKEAKPGKIVLFMKKHSFFVCRKFFFFSKWILWHNLLIALFSEKIMCCFLKNFFLKDVASTLLSSHTCV